MNEYEIYGSWRIYYTRVILLPFMIIGPLAYVFIFGMTELHFKIIGLLLLFPIYLNFKYWWKIFKTPTLSITKDTITLCNQYGKIYVVNPINSYSLVISNDYLAFRKDEQQDVMVNIQFFNKFEWYNLIKFLKDLPFIRIIQGVSK